jgi:hypothetical protein
LRQLVAVVLVEMEVLVEALEALVDIFLAAFMLRQ